MKKLLILSVSIMIISSLSTTVQPTEPTHETLKCTVTSLEEYGFIQESKHKEYVCFDPNNYTNFIIIEDKHGQHKLDDSLAIKLNKNNEIISVQSSN